MKKLLFTLLIGGMCILNASADDTDEPGDPGGETVAYQVNNKEFIKEVFENCIENMNATEETYTRYFSEDYIQYVDGKVLNYKDFICHMKVQKSVLKCVKITFKYMVAEGDKIATVHIAEAIKKNGKKIKAQINAIFQFRDGKIILCDELTRLVEGEKADEDLGSRH